VIRFSGSLGFKFAQTLSQGQNRLHAGAAPAQCKPLIELDPTKVSYSPYAASSIKRAAKYGRFVGLDEVRKIELVVCGSVAVNHRGARVGKGAGYPDLEFALLTENKKDLAKTPIVISCMTFKS
jgi:5-formyltetrahydrofolate cyclo-ligase